MDQRDKDLDDELRFHLEAEAELLREAGLPEAEARCAALRSLGNVTQVKEETRMLWTWTRMEQLLQDARFGWRQLGKSKATSAAAILSLALATGACMGAFRLIDALLLRPLPIENASNLYVVARHGVGPNGKYRVSESASYPFYQEIRAAVAGRAEVIAISYSERVDITYGADADMEKAHRQFVSGHMFTSFGLRPALGRLLSENDDHGPHAFAVISNDYWKSRFGQDTSIVGRTFRMGTDLIEIAGVLDGPFSGTEPGTMVDFFLPMSARPAAVLHSKDSFWLRPFLRPGADSSMPVLLDQLTAVYLQHERERAKTFINFPKQLLANYPTDRLLLEPAFAGTSKLQQDNRLGLIVIGILVGLVLLIACVNVGNLMLARALARTREMALRISIGASRARLVRLMLLESAWIAVLATTLGALFAWRAAPFVVDLINPANNPARVQLPADWRVLLFGAGLTISVTVLFGLLPALRASGLHPAAALKGGDDPHSRRRLMHVLIAVQVAFCSVVLFVGGLFAATYTRISQQPVGFNFDRVLALETVASAPQLPIYWAQLAQHLRSVPGVESVEFAEWPLMSGEMSNRFIAFNGGPPLRTSLTYFYKVSPGWRAAMKVPLIRGRDLLSTDTFPNTVLVNETFTRLYLKDQEPVGRSFEIAGPGGKRISVLIAGVTGDARYDDMHGPIPPVVYAPYATVDAEGALLPNRRATLDVRTAAEDASALAATLRREVGRFRSEFRVTNIRTQRELVEMQTIRERLLAMLALFFSLVALALAAVGLYGVLDYSVLQRRREIGIRLALGASPGGVVRGVTGQTLAMVMLGAAAGALVGYASQRYLAGLLFGIEPNDWTMLAAPAAVLLLAALVAAVPPAIRAVRLDPWQTLRSE